MRAHAVSCRGFSSQEYKFCAALVLWVAVQIAVLYSQAKWGPRWFVPRRWRPHKYDYHREVRSSAAALACRWSLAAAVRRC